jgi:restriction-modification enzyme MmeI-like protein
MANSSGSSGGLTPAQFVAKWKPAELSERAASQEHFIDLCRMLGQPTPAEHDSTGAEYAFEKGVAVTAGASKGAKGDHGFADVWWRAKFGWEYKRKGKYKDLKEAYGQLCKYREALDNPPLLVVSDIQRTEIHTNFTGTAKQIHVIKLDDLAEPENVALLRRVFTDPKSFKPTITPEKITEDVAEQFKDLAEGLHARDHDPHDVAHFLMKCLFCLFAEDVDLLPDDLFKRTISQWQSEPKKLAAVMSGLFDAMRTGGAFGPEPIDWFNGGLFDEAPALELTGPEVGVLMLAAKQDWASVEPSIFGTLFERSLDPDKRSQIGAHYTSREDILLIVDPVVMAPLRREWDTIRAECDELVKQRSQAQQRRQQRQHKKGDLKPETYTKRITEKLRGFDEKLSHLRILDPACGSGNFLYVAIQQLLDLEKAVTTYAAGIGEGMVPHVRPTQLLGIELNDYAAELAQVVIWIGYLQWMRDNGFNTPRDPILENLQTIEHRDAILDLSDPDHPKPAHWPDADFIIGNPPFLGGSLIWEGLGTDYRDALWMTYDIPNFSDLCCYWFEVARLIIEERIDNTRIPPRVGLLATQGIRGGSNRETIKRIKKTGDIFFAESDRPWILDGAAVHVSMIGFDSGSEKHKLLNGTLVESINFNLTTGLNISTAQGLNENKHLCNIGTKKSGLFELSYEAALTQLNAPTNPNGRRNVDVLHPWAQGKSVNSRWSGEWIIDFGTSMNIEDAAQYEIPFNYVLENVKPARDKNKRASYRLKWWLHAEARPGMRSAINGLHRMLGTVSHAKHRMFTWLDTKFLPDGGLFIFARSDDYFFGVLHSSMHELWALRQGTQLEDRPRYTPTSCFATFPLPWPPDEEPAEHPAWKRIGEAAKALNEQRERWLNPPEWIGPLAETVDALEDFSDVPEDARGLIRESAIMAMAAKDKRLKKRTLTNLYNEKPTWLALAHETLDRAVLAAYAATDPEGDWDEDWAEVWKDSGAGQPLPDDHPLAERRAEVDQAVLGNLLRLNQARSG